MSENKRIDKKVIIILSIGIVIGIVLALLASALRYDMNWIIGKHYDDIIARYGEFDYGNSEYIPYKTKHSNYFCGRYKERLEYNNCTGYIYRDYLKRVYDSTGTCEEFPLVLIEFDSEGYAKCVSYGYTVPVVG